jgi:hypothetical protein
VISSFGGADRGLCYVMVCATSALYILGVCNSTKDEGRPLGTGLQEQVSNHLKLLW